MAVWLLLNSARCLSYCMLITQFAVEKRGNTYGNTLLSLVALVSRYEVQTR
jgi:hypothetical protein